MEEKMTRKAYDRWKIEANQFNRATVFYVECNCGKLAQKKYQQSYFECGTCQRKYVLQQGQYVELKN